ncbi:hypothetical protein FPOAC2_09243 [Fusarium poae]|uniref:Uncharacterized protein n=1 Tax=Fusarium poae TaxID=36050 RepID=A0A1B8ANH3_FUSPO|nr:hypothetical protein FPOAC1_009303 [Fusarium poae]KAG8669901.1 hypothetical protein FPOAC1_009303 [Fusarium poae]OBS22110.1 hypothetical protein FPOA_08447 [Fusarium poae]
MKDGIIKFEGCDAPERERDSLYFGTFLLRLNRAADATGGGSIPYSGYQRALQLYGNENAFDLSHAQRRNLLDCKNLEMNRSIARKAGYDPDAGRSAPWAGVYFSGRHILTYPGPINTPFEQSGQSQSTAACETPMVEEDLTTFPGCGTTVVLARTTEDQLVKLHEDQLAKLHDLITGSPIKPHSTLYAGLPLLPSTDNNDHELHEHHGDHKDNKPITLRGMSGSRVPTANKFASTCVGGMEMAVVVTELLERVVNEDFNNEWKKTITETLDYIGGSENMYAFLDVMYKQFPKKVEASPASTIGCRLRGSN